MSNSCNSIEGISPLSVSAKEQQEKLRIVEWNHLNLSKFYPMALCTSWTVRCMLYPLSVVKARLQLQKQNNVYSGMRHAFVDIVRNEGFFALYRGFWVTLPQLSASFVYSTIYEKLRSILHLHGNITSPPIVSAAAGGVASCVTQIIFVPTDIVSQHMMIYNNPQHFSGGSNRHNVAVIECLRNDNREKRLTLGLRVMRAVYKCDGVSGFYRGFLSSLLLYIPSSMTFWLSYYNALALLRNTRASLSRSSSDTREDLLLLQAISGSFGGIVAACVTNPFEVLRVRVQVHRTSYLDTIKRLYMFEGVLIFTKGLAPRILSNSIYSCLIMIGYETVKRASVLPEYKKSIVW